MIFRLLPRDEWWRLLGTELEAVHPLLPADAKIVVVEDDEAIVGCWAVYPQIHVEGCWIAESHRRRAGVARRLIEAMKSVAQSMGAQAVQTASLSEPVTRMLDTLGAVELPGRHFSLRVK